MLMCQQLAALFKGAHIVTNPETAVSASSTCMLAPLPPLLRLLLHLQTAIVQFGIVGQPVGNDAFVRRGFRVGVL